MKSDWTVLIVYQDVDSLVHLVLLNVDFVVSESINFRTLAAISDQKWRKSFLTHRDRIYFPPGTRLRTSQKQEVHEIIFEWKTVLLLQPRGGVVRGAGEESNSWPSSTRHPPPLAARPLIPQGCDDVEPVCKTCCLFEGCC